MNLTEVVLKARGFLCPHSAHFTFFTLLPWIKFILRGQSRGTASVQSRGSSTRKTVGGSRSDPLCKSREIAHERLQYVHYLVYYVMAKLLLGEVTVYVMYCSL